jgi:microbial collagenase
MAALSLAVVACGDDNGNGGGPDNEAPNANFEPPACQQLSCDFTDSSTDPDGSIASRSWTFENGTPANSTEQNPTSVFSVAGTHTVTLTVTDNEGETDDYTREVTVVGAPGNEAPTAAFTFECASLACTFTDASTDADGTIASRDWNFGEEGAPDNTSTEPNPTHTYSFTEQTEVTVTLTVTDDDGAPATTTQTFDVSPAWHAGLPAAHRGRCHRQLGNHEQRMRVDRQHLQGNHHAAYRHAGRGNALHRRVQ